jgi:hypothetical protein
MNGPPMIGGEGSNSIPDFTKRFGTTSRLPPISKNPGPLPRRLGALDPLPSKMTVGSGLKDSIAVGGSTKDLRRPRNSEALEEVESNKESALGIRPRPSVGQASNDFEKF